jgi:subtilisin family serine protease
MTGRRGAWRQHGGQANAGDGVVVGVIDTGIWPESKSFAGLRLTRTPKTRWDIHRRGKNTFMDKSDGGRFQGFCETGDEFTVRDCSTKIVGARFYDTYWDGLSPEIQGTEEFESPRDGAGHGSHTAGTAAGNAGVKARAEGRRFGRISGMAPAAKIAVYKVLWEPADPEFAGGSTVDIVAAINDAVADGVDVLNYSIGGGVESSAGEPELLAFEGAAEAGIFIATSASNDGPAAETVEKAVPWMTSVAASTHTNVFEATVVLGDGTRIPGASVIDEPLGSRPLIDATDAAPAGATPAEVEDATLCGPESLDDAAVAGKIVVCARGIFERVAKSAEVARAGGAGMILANLSDNSLNAEFHSVPTVHISHLDSPTVYSYLESAGADATARFRVGNITGETTPFPQIAGFSGRGPASMVEGDMIKPDITAPGVDVLAAVAPPSNSGRRFNLYSGTSMASPHIAGLAAFLTAERPRWSAMQIKSAMMTTATSLVGPDGRRVHDPFAQGSGHVKPRRMFDPGLFVTSDKADWLAFLTGQGIDTGIRPITPGEVNQPSFAEGEATGPVSFHRELTANRKGRWRVDVDVPGYEASHRARVVASRKGDVVDLRVTFTRTTAQFGEFAKGFVTLTGPTRVRMPVALRPVSVDAPSSVAGSGTDGSVEVAVTAGFTGDLDVTPTGLAPATTEEGTVAVSAIDLLPTTGDGCFDVSETSKALQVTLDSAEDDADLDLFVIRANADCTVLEEIVGQSATGSADESVLLEDPEPGNYVFAVDGFADGASADDAMAYRLDWYDVNEENQVGNFHAEPDPVPVTENEETTFDAVWEGLDPDSRYLGIIEYEGALSPTYVAVDTTTP